MRPHATDIDANLVTSADDGSVWALWQVLAAPFRFASTDACHAHHSAITTILRNAPGPTLMFSACQPVTASLVERALRTEAVPSAALDHRVSETIRAHITEPDGALYERTFWLAAQIRPGTSDSTLAAAKHAAGTVVDRAMSVVLDHRSVAADQTGALSAAVDDVEARLSVRVVDDDVGYVDDDEAPTPECGTLHVRRARPSDFEWLTLRLPRRATAADVSLTDWEPTTASTAGRLLRLNNAAWAENYTEDATITSRRPRWHVAAFVDGSDEVSYQSTLVLAAAPTEIFYPGGFSEWLVRAQHVRTRKAGAVPVDWYVYAEPVRGDKARKRVESRLVNAADQQEQQDSSTGVTATVLDDADVLRRLRDRIDSGETLLRTITWFTIASSSEKELEAHVDAFRGRWSKQVYDLPRPEGDQEEYARASQPGALLPKAIASDYVRETTPDIVAAGAPFAGAAVGDPYGVAAGINLGDGLGSVAYWDPGYGIRERNDSGSALFVGKTGSGKSQTKKTLAEALAIRGSRFVVIDPEREYLALAAAVGGQIVDPFDADARSLDPLAIYIGLPERTKDDEARDRAANAAIGIVHAFTGGRFDAHDSAWADLRYLIDYALTGGFRLRDVIEWMNTRDPATGLARYPSLSDLAKPMSVAVRLPRLRSLFEPTLYPFSATAALTVITAKGLRLRKDDGTRPSAEELEGETLLFAAVHAAREAVYEDKGRYGAVVIDEGRALLQTDYGRMMLWDLFDRGRKHQAGAWLSITDPAVVGDEFFAQAGALFVFKLETAAAARKASSYFGDAAGNPDIVRVLRNLRSGQCVMRDVRGQVGLVQILRPVDPVIAEAVQTTPKQRLDDDVPVDDDWADADEPDLDEKELQPV